MKEPCAKHQMLIKMPTIHGIIINFANMIAFTEKRKSNDKLRFKQN